MSFGGNKFSKILRIVIDVLNVILGVSAIVLAVMVFIHTKENQWMFPIIFLIGCIMNLISGIKYLMTDRKISGIVAEVAAVILFVIAFVSYRAIGGLA